MAKRKDVLACLSTGRELAQPRAKHNPSVLVVDQPLTVESLTAGGLVNNFV